MLFIGIVQYIVEAEIGLLFDNQTLLHMYFKIVVFSFEKVYKKVLLNSIPFMKFID